MTRPALTAPVVSRNSRRVTLVRVLMSRSLRGAMDRGANALVGPAAADVRHRHVDIDVRRMGVLREQGGRPHYLAWRGVAAWGGFLFHPGALPRVRAVR